MARKKLKKGKKKQNLTEQYVNQLTRLYLKDRELVHYVLDKMGFNPYADPEYQIDEHTTIDVNAPFNRIAVAHHFLCDVLRKRKEDESVLKTHLARRLNATLGVRK